MRNVTQGDNLSKAAKLARLPYDQQSALLEGMDPEELAYNWEFWRRPDQTIPPGDFSVIVFSGGRGGGKTRTATEWVREKAMSMPRSRGLIVSRTAADGRDVTVLGDSGLLSIHPPSEMPQYEPSKRLLTWPNGSTAQLYCATEDTEALTKRGWKRHNEIVAGTDEVWSLNPATQRGEWSPVLCVNAFPVDMVPLYAPGESAGIDAAVTLDHRWPVRDSGGELTWRASPLALRHDDKIIRTAPAAGVSPTMGCAENAENGDMHELIGWVGVAGEVVTVPSGPMRTVCTDVDGYRAYMEDRFNASGATFVELGRAIGWTPTLVRSAIRIPQRSKDVRATLRYALRATEIDSFFVTLQDDTCLVCRIVLSRDDPHRASAIPVVRSLLARMWPRVLAMSGVQGPAWKETVTGNSSVFILTMEATRELLRAMHNGTQDTACRRMLVGVQHVGTLDTTSTAGALVERAVVESGVRFSYTEDSTLLVEDSAFSPSETLSGPIGDVVELPAYTGTVWCPTTGTGTWLARRGRSVYFTGNSSETPNALRGPQGHWGLAEELATWVSIPDDSGLTAWDNLQIAVRLGRAPQIFVATTPKRTKVMRELYARAETDPSVLLMHTTTRANMGNLSKSYIDVIYNKYAGTSLAAQELEGVFMDEVAGALWSSEVLDRTRVDAIPAAVEDFVVAVDPSVSENKGDLAGIVVVGSTPERTPAQRSVYVVADYSLQGTPQQWIEQAVRAAQHYSAPIVIERNQGGRLLTDAIHSVDHRLRVHSIQARASKQLRAEPVVLAFERGQVHIVQELPALEQEMLSWVPDTRMKSPDRIDALVYGVSYFLADSGRGGYRPARMSVTSAARMRLPQPRGVLGRY